MSPRDRCDRGLRQLARDLLLLPSGVGCRLRSRLLAELDWAELYPEEADVAVAIAEIGALLAAIRRPKG